MPMAVVLVAGDADLTGCVFEGSGRKEATWGGDQIAEGEAAVAGGPILGPRARGDGGPAGAAMHW
jgi:hypothetical protein